jgi:hypothetical protein
LAVYYDFGVNIKYKRQMHEKKQGEKL